LCVVLGLLNAAVGVELDRRARQLAPAEARHASRGVRNEPSSPVHEPRRRGRRCAAAGLGITALATAMALDACLLARAPARLAVGVVILLLALGSALSLLASLRRGETGGPLEPLIVGLLCEAGLGVLLIVEGTWKVLVGDEVATLIGIASIGVSPMLQALVGRLGQIDAAPRPGPRRAGSRRLPSAPRRITTAAIVFVRIEGSRKTDQHSR
jgi:hypothetical protein